MLCSYMVALGCLVWQCMSWHCPSHQQPIFIIHSNYHTCLQSVTLTRPAMLAQRLCAGIASQPCCKNKSCSSQKTPLVTGGLALTLVLGLSEGRLAQRQAGLHPSSAQPCAPHLLHRTQSAGLALSCHHAHLSCPVASPEVPACQHAYSHISVFACTFECSPSTDLSWHDC